MAERTWITRNEIADIHDRLADIAHERWETMHEADHRASAETIRGIEKVGVGVRR